MQWSPSAWLRTTSGLGVLVVLLELWTGFRVDSAISYVLRWGPFMRSSGDCATHSIQLKQRAVELGVDGPLYSHPIHSPLPSNHPQWFLFLGLDILVTCGNVNPPLDHVSCRANQAAHHLYCIFLETVYSHPPSPSPSLPTTHSGSWFLVWISL